MKVFYFIVVVVIIIIIIIIIVVVVVIFFFFFLIMLVCFISVNTINVVEDIIIGGKNPKGKIAPMTLIWTPVIITV